MIDVKKVEGDMVTYHCSDCEKMRQCAVEFEWKLGKKKPDEFFKLHETCGEECPELWTKESDLAFNRNIDILRNIYTEFPGIRAAKAIALCKERNKNFEAMKSEVKE